VPVVSLQSDQLLDALQFAVGQFAEFSIENGEHLRPLRTNLSVLNSPMGPHWTSVDNARSQVQNQKDINLGYDDPRADESTWYSTPIPRTDHPLPLTSELDTLVRRRGITQAEAGQLLGLDQSP